MAPTSTISDVFVLSAFDRDQWCTVLEARFRADNIRELRSILGLEAADDPELHHEYMLNGDELAAVAERFAVPFDMTALGCEAPDIFLSKVRPSSRLPYLVHTGYELPLLREGRKSLARMYHEYPPETFDGEDKFDHWVTMGLLSKTVFNDPFDHPVKGWIGIRYVYYTLIGEEWRVPAMRMLFEASKKSGGWNEHFERMEGMLFGYSDAENDWWINEKSRRGGVGGISVCRAVDREGLAWIEAAGFRALPPTDRPTVTIHLFPDESATDCKNILSGEEDAVALVRFNLFGKHLLDIIGHHGAGPWDFPSSQISVLNRYIRGQVEVVARRGPQ